MTSLVQAIEARFAFNPPNAFRALALDRSRIEWPILPEFHWLDAAEIAEFQFLDHQWPDFVPFARNTHDDLWCWCPELASGERIPIGYCPANCEEGEICAPEFGSALFRLICDAARFLSATPSLVSTARQLLASSAEFPGVHWPAEWRDWLRRLSSSPVSYWSTKHGTASGLLSQSEYDHAVSAWLDDGETGSVFRWMTAP
jgi:hypothetical protein